MDAIYAVLLFLAIPVLSVAIACAIVKVYDFNDANSGE